MYNLFYRNFKAIEYLPQNKKISKKELYRLSVLNCLRSIAKLKREYLSYEGSFYFLFDNPTSKINLRKQLSDTYKVAREKEDTDFYQAVEKLKEFLLFTRDNDYVVYFELLEADDFVLPLLRSIDPKESILLVSMDMDWARCIEYQDRKIHWLVKDEVFDKIKFKEKYEFYPSISSVSIYKSIRGDRSDSIPVGVSNFPKKQLIEACEKFVDIKDFIFNCSKLEGISEHFIRKIKLFEKRLILNWSLIDFIDLKLLNTTVENNIYSTKSNKLYLKLLEDFKSLGVKKKPKKITGKGFFTEETIKRK